MSKEKTTKEKLIDEFDEKFNHPNLWCDCAMEYDNERQRNGVKQFISDIIAQTREETIREVGEGLPLEYHPDGGYENGFNSCLSEIKQSLKSLINK